MVAAKVGGARGQDDVRLERYQLLRRAAEAIEVSARER